MQKVQSEEDAKWLQQEEENLVYSLYPLLGFGFFLQQSIGFFAADIVDSKTCGHTVSCMAVCCERITVAACAIQTSTRITFLLFFYYPHF